MSSFPELVNKIAADKEQAARLSGLITKSQTETEQIASSLGGVGFEERSKLFKGAGERLEQAESLRQTLEGTLAKAHWQLMSAIHGKMGLGSREHASFTQQNPDGSTVWRGWRDGSKVEITTLPPGREHEPTGMELLEDREKRPGKLSSFRTAARDAARMALVSETGQPLPPETFREVPNQGLNAGDVVGNSLVWAVGTAAVIAKIRKRKEDDDGR